MQTDAERALIDTLTARLGAAAVLTEAGDMAGHLVETRGLYRGEALAVVRPRDRDEVAFEVANAPTYSHS